jgi:hypothetical protein
MAIRLKSLEGLSDDEEEKVIDLLKAKGIAYYTTPRGRHMAGVEAIWLSDNSQLSEANSVLSEYNNSNKHEITNNNQTSILSSKIFLFTLSLVITALAIFCAIYIL